MLFLFLLMALPAGGPHVSSGGMSSNRQLVPIISPHMGQIYLQNPPLDGSANGLKNGYESMFEHVCHSAPSSLCGCHSCLLVALKIWLIADAAEVGMRYGLWLSVLSVVVQQ